MMIDMKCTISETRAMEIVHEFLEEVLLTEGGIISLYVIGSLGGGYYRPGQSDIDTVIIVRDDTKTSQKEMDELANKYRIKYSVPKGFGSVLIRESELLPPYSKSDTDEFEFTIEIARLKLQGKPIYGAIDINDILMPSKEDFIKDALIMERWFNREFGYHMFDKLQITGCINSILGILRRYLIIEKGVFVFNKYKTIDAYLQNNPPIVDKKVFDLIGVKLRGEIAENNDELQMLRACGIRLRDYFNRNMLHIDSRTV